MSALVSLRNIVKRYTRGKQQVEVLHSLNLDIPEGEFLALDEHFVGALALYVCAVGAVVGEDEFVVAALDGAVVARGLVVVDVDAAVLVAPEGDGVVVAAAHVVLVAITQGEEGVRRTRFDAPWPRASWRFPTSTPS